MHRVACWRQQSSGSVQFIFILFVRVYKHCYNSHVKKIAGRTVSYRVVRSVEILLGSSHTVWRFTILKCWSVKQTLHLLVPVKYHSKMIKNRLMVPRSHALIHQNDLISCYTHTLSPKWCCLLLEAVSENRRRDTRLYSEFTALLRETDFNPAGLHSRAILSHQAWRLHSVRISGYAGRAFWVKGCSSEWEQVYKDV